MKNVAVIGAGAAGLVSAYFALENGAEVTLYERNQQLGRKICITGKGRCNLTNAVSARDFLEQVVHGGKFLSSALYRFDPYMTMEWFESLGLRLKVERGNRVFPASEKAGEVRDVLRRAVLEHRNCHLLRARVKDVRVSEGRFSVVCESRTKEHDSVVLCTGGASYPLTGSTGDGYVFAERLGHSVSQLYPSLVRVICEDPCCADAQGVSLKNVRLSLYEEGTKKALYSQQGELLFTDDGVSGPLVLSASAHLRGISGKTRFEINFKPALSREEVDARLLRDFAQNTNRNFKYALDDLLPAKMRPIFVRLSGISPDRKVHQITREERARLVDLFCAFPLKIRALGPMDEAIVTAGGVALSEIDPRTMESRICPGLFFAGEVLDVDAYTGGFNLQIAFSTGRLAGECAARGMLQKNTK